MSDDPKQPARHAIHNLELYRSREAPWPNGALGVLKAFVDEVSASPSPASDAELPTLLTNAGAIDANRLEAMAKEMPDECFLKGSGVLKLIAAIRQLECAARAASTRTASEPPEVTQLRADNILLMGLREAAGKLIKAKGRFHTEQNYGSFVAAFELCKPCTASDTRTAALEAAARVVEARFIGFRVDDAELTAMAKEIRALAQAAGEAECDAAVPAAPAGQHDSAAAADDEIVGHKTFSAEGGGFRHEPLRRGEADAIMEQVEARERRRAELMPDEAAARSIFFDAWLRLKELGWREAAYCPKDGTEFEVIEAGSTGVHRCFYSGEWPSGHWLVLADGDAYPSRPVLYRSIKEAASAPVPRVGGNTQPESFAVELGRESIAARTQADAGKADTTTKPENT